jgi:uncharacterized protein YcbX
MHVDQLWRYPVKSMAGEQLDETWIGVDGIPGDRVLYVLDGRDEIVSARTRPWLLRHRASTSDDGEVLVDGLPWHSDEVAALVRVAAGPDARLVQADGAERFDILPLLVATDGALSSFGRDFRRLRPNIVIAGVDGLAERGWPWTTWSVGDAVVAMADLRGRCIVTTFDPVSVEQDVNVLRDINARFGGRLALNAWAGASGSVRVGDPVAPATVSELAVASPGRFVSG